MRFRSRHLATPFLAALLASGPVPTTSPASADPIVIGETVEITSAILGETRTARVHVPDPADHGEGPHPVLVVLDGRPNFQVAVGITSMLVRADLVPPMVVVGVDNTERFRDLTSPWEGYDGPEPGGADAFIRFLDEELLPAVGERVRLAGHRTLVGHSLGGILVNRLLATRPGLFQGLVSVSPSAWWRDQGLDDELRDAWASDVVPPRDTALFVSLANEDPERTSGTRAGFDELRETLATAPSPIRVTTRDYPDRNHISTYALALQDGLGHVFADWDLDALIAAGDLAALEARVALLSRRTGLEVRPTDDWSLAHMGRGKTRAGDPGGAIEVLEWARGFHPASIAVLNFLGEAYEADARYDDALATYRASREVAVETGSPMVRWIDRRIGATEAALEEVRTTPGR